jgi:perosamine synthetase
VAYPLDGASLIETRLILTAGPEITDREVSYGLDAIKNGWNEHYADYIERFENAFAEYVGVKHALTVSSGTAALHLAMRALGIGEGDEVIVPDQTFVAVANAVQFTGATPVTCDVERDTWCIDPLSFKGAITKKTKAVVPVWTYGQAPQLDEILAIAHDHGLYIVEDACPAVGSRYKGRHAGSMGDVAAFSFQGAKILVTGEGGMLVTNNTDHYEKARSLRVHGRDPKKEFWHTDIGYMYRLSNVQAAIGLGQLEHIDTMVAKKQQIFQWYKERLMGSPALTLNTENEWSKSNYWMSSIVLDDDHDRQALRSSLLERAIDTRPFFYPISALPMYHRGEVTTPVSHYLGRQGINLPSGVMLTEEKVDYIATTVLELL